VEDNEEIWQFRDGMMAKVLDGDTSEAFPVTIGGCMLALSLFSCCADRCLSKLGEWHPVRYRTDG